MSRSAWVARMYILSSDGEVTSEVSMNEDDK